MGCDNCPGSKKPENVDKRGNIKNTRAELDDRKERMAPYLIPTNPVLESITFEEYVAQKTIYRKQAEAMSSKAVNSFSDDYKRIQIQELIDVVNHEDASPLSPSQALKALNVLSYMDGYKNVFEEFSGLTERVHDLYERIIENNKIKYKWNR